MLAFTRGRQRQRRRLTRPSPSRCRTMAASPMAASISTSRPTPSPSTSPRSTTRRRAPTSTDHRRRRHRATCSTAADFGFSRRRDGNALVAVRITTLPSAGTLTLTRRRGDCRTVDQRSPTSMRACLPSRRPPMPTAPPTPPSPSRCRTMAAPPMAASISTRRPTRITINVAGGQRRAVGHQTSTITVGGRHRPRASRRPISASATRPTATRWRRSRSPPCRAPAR